MDQLALQLEATMIEPMRKEAISKLSGPEILQVHRSSSRPTEKRKPKTTVNSLSKIAGAVFLFPLLGRWWIQVHDQYALIRLLLILVVHEEFILNRFCCRHLLAQ
jgi:hypothetical protein